MYISCCCCSFWVFFLLLLPLWEPERNLGESVADIVTRAMEEMEGRPVLDVTAPTDLYTDGSCLAPGKPWAAAGWGVHIVNSDKLGDYYGALPGNIQTNSRAELVALETALQLA